MSLQQPNRRKHSDLLHKALTWLNAAAVISLLFALCLAAIAKPELETFFDRYYNLSLRRTWNHDLVDYIGLMLAASCLSSIGGLYVNSKRLRRKTDYIHATLVFSLVASCVGLGLFFYRFF